MGRRKKEEGRRKKEEGRRKKEEGRRKNANLDYVIARNEAISLTLGLLRSSQ
ncbi:hypothetical protein [Microcoleus sp. A6-C5]|uniref:hypothetical protein n=1 Tax=Microcoleus sp. A6-C5 TaxID=2818547 RepID=UPI002FD248A9